MSRDRLHSSSISSAVEWPRNQAHTPNPGRPLGRLVRPARAVALATLGLALVLLSACGQQLPPASAAPAVAPAAIESAASPELALALAAVSTPIPTVEATPTPDAPPSVIVFPSEAASVEVLDLVAASPADEAPVVDQDELIAELRPRLSARSSRRSDAQGATSAEPIGADATLSAEMTTEQMSTAAAATKTPTPKPIVRTATPRPATKTPTPRPTATATSSSTLGARVASIAMRYIGYRYTYGGVSPSTGFDCSGFAYYVYKTAGRPISRSLSAQYNTGAWVSRANLRPGDLVFFKNTYRYGLSHVAIYVGGGRFAHAQSESTGVTTNSFDSYWSSHYLGARRP